MGSLWLIILILIRIKLQNSSDTCDIHGRVETDLPSEYIVQAQVTKKAIWLQSLLSQLIKDDKEPMVTVIFGDNQGAIALAKNPQFHSRTKPIAIEHHFVCEKQAEGKVELQYIPTKQQVADRLPKALLFKDRFIIFGRPVGLDMEDSLSYMIFILKTVIPK